MSDSIVGASIEEAGIDESARLKNEEVRKAVALKDENPSLGEEKARNVSEKPSSSQSVYQANSIQARRPDPVSDYLDLISDWRKPEIASNAEKMRVLREGRQSAMAEILASPSHMHDPRLKAVMPYMAADMASKTKPAPSSRSYLDVVARNDEIREKMYNGVREGSAGGYLRAAKMIENTITSGKNPRLEYEMLDLRRTTVLRNYNNPKFFLDIARSYSGKSSGQPNMRDEVLVDFDRQDLMDNIGKGRTDSYAYAFAKSFRDIRQLSEAPGVTKIGQLEAFMNMKATGTQIRQNPAAIFKLEDARIPDDPSQEPAFNPASQNPKYKGPSLNFNEKEMNIIGAALEQRPFSAGELKAFYQGFPMGKERYDVMSKTRDRVTLFTTAYDRFIEQYKAGDPSIGTTFAVLEKTAASIHGNEKLSARMAAESPEAFAALSLFSPKSREAEEKRAVKIFYDNVADSTAYKANANLVSRERDGSITEERTEGKEKKKASISAKKITDKSIIEVVDGETIRIAESRETMESGDFFDMKIKGIVAPKLGQKSIDGMENAGAAAKANLEDLISRYRKSDLGIKIDDGLGKGSATVDIRLPDGENLSQRLIRDGFAAPDHTMKSSVRFDNLARQAETANRGLWKNGFFKPSSGWGKENQPNISAEESSRITTLVGMSMIGSASRVSDTLSHEETRIFAMPVKNWGTRSLARKAAADVAKDDPRRMKSILDRNQEILRDLRARHAGLSEKELVKLEAMRKNVKGLNEKDMEVFSDLSNRSKGLSKEEKLAHDRLTMGSRLISRALSDAGYLSKEERDSMDGPMLSKFGLNINMSISEKAKKRMLDGYKKGVSDTRGVVDTMMDMASRF